MRRHFVTLAVIVAIAVAWYIAREHKMSGQPLHTPSSTPTSSSALTATATATSSGSAADAPRVRQISRADRERLALQISAAQAARAARVATAVKQGAAEAPALPALPALPADDHTHDLDHVSEPVLEAMQQAIPFLAACYEQQGSAHPAAGEIAVAQMTLTNDPDIGAVIDADQILDDKQAPLDPQVDACLRSTMQTLQLPPLDAGDHVKMQYSFKLK